MPTSSESATVTVTVEITLPRDEWIQLKLADRLSTFLAFARGCGAETRLRPTPDEIDQELGEITRAIVGLPADRRAAFDAQIGRIERTNRFRRLVS